MARTERGLCRPRTRGRWGRSSGLVPVRRRAGLGRWGRGPGQVGAPLPAPAVVLPGAPGCRPAPNRRLCSGGYAPSFRDCKLETRPIGFSIPSNKRLHGVQTRRLLQGVDAGSVGASKVMCGLRRSQRWPLSAMGWADLSKGPIEEGSPRRKDPQGKGLLVRSLRALERGGWGWGTSSAACGKH